MTINIRQAAEGVQNLAKQYRSVLEMGEVLGGIADLESRRDETEKALGLAQKELSAVRAKLPQLEAVGDLHRAKAEAQAALAAINAEAAGAQTSLDQLKRQIAEAETEQDALKQSLAADSERLNAIRAEINATRNRLKEV